MKKKILKYFQYKNFYFFVCLIFVVQFYDGFLNIYIILKNNYEERMIRHGGYCEKQAYGFTYHINKKYNYTNYSKLHMLSAYNYKQLVKLFELHCLSKKKLIF